MKYLVLALPLVMFACSTTPDTQSAETQTTESSVAQNVAKSDETVSCSLGGDARAISNRQLVDGGCEVAYTKFDETKVVASAANDSAHCDGIASRIQTNLENAGFTCK